MKNIPIGIIDTKHNFPVFIRASDCGNEHYGGVELRTDRRGNPVIVMRSNDPTPMPWKVAFGCSQIYFRTFKDVMAFCESHGFWLVFEEVD